MARIILAMPPFFICFIMPCIWSNWASRRFTSCTGTPEPAAMRLARGLDEFRLGALGRGHGIEDAFRAAQLLLGLAALQLAGGLLELGRQLFQQRAHVAQLLDLAELVAEVVQVELVARFDLGRELCASAMSMFFWACSTSDTMSPMRCAMRSG